MIGMKPQRRPLTIALLSRPQQPEQPLPRADCVGVLAWLLGTHQPHATTTHGHRLGSTVGAMPSIAAPQSLHRAGGTGPLGGVASFSSMAPGRPGRHRRRATT
jgi:hypothetical protein